MIISVKRHFGATQVVGGRLLRVAEPHFVSTKGAPAQTKEKLRKYDKPTVVCEAGDLVMEILAKRGRKLLGHTYLTGPALQIVSYAAKEGRAEERWFEEGPRAVGVEIPKPPEDRLDDEEAWKTFIATTHERLLHAKYLADVDIAALELTTKADPLQVVQHICDLWCYKHDPEPGQEPMTSRAHLLVQARRGKTIAYIHSQPPHAIADVSMTYFQFDLIMSHLKERN